MTPAILWAVLAGHAVAIGLALGSFANVLVHRLPHDQSLWPRSACAACGTAIPGWQNVPVLSYLWLRGRCATCQAPIGALHPVVEALGGALGWLAWRRCVPDAAAITPINALAAGALLLFLIVLLANTLIDVRHRILPDPLTIYSVPVALVVVAALDYGGWHDFPATTWRASVLGAVAGGGFLAAMAVVSEWLLGREGLGWGDVKLMALIGAALGVFPGGFVSLLVGALLGSLVGVAQLVVTRRRSYLPLGPFLAFAAASYALFGDVWMPVLLPGLAIFAR